MCFFSVISATAHATGLCHSNCHQRARHAPRPHPRPARPTPKPAAWRSNTPLGAQPSPTDDAAPSEGMTQTDEAWGQGEGAGATGSEPEAHYDSCDECRAAMCSNSWEVCQAEPLCTSGLGCLGGECGASGSLECASACFDDDLELALVAFQLYACSELQCPVECG